MVIPRRLLDPDGNRWTQYQLSAEIKHLRSLLVADEVHEVAASPSAVFSSYSDNFLVTGVEVQIVDGSGRHPFPVRHPILLDTDNIAMSTPNPEDEDPTVLFSLPDEGTEAGLLLRLVYQEACASVAWPMVGMKELNTDDELRKRYVKRATSKTVQGSASTLFRRD